MLNASLTDVRKAVTLVWSEVLNVKGIYPHDDFVSLGGNPLLAVHCSYLLSQHYGYKVLPKHFFEHSTLENIALFIFRQNAESFITEPKKFIKNHWGHNPFTVLEKPAQTMDLGTVVLNKVSDDLEPVFCIHAVIGNVFEYQSLAHYLNGKRTVYGLTYKKLFTDDKSIDLESLVIRGAQQIRHIQPHGPYYLLGRASDGVLACLIAEELEKNGGDISFLGLIDPPFDEIIKPTHQSGSWLRDLQGFLNFKQQGSSCICLDNIDELKVDKRVNFFNVTRYLNEIGRTKNLLNRLDVQPYCWWSSHGSKHIKNNISSQIKKNIASSTSLFLSPSEIIHSEQLCCYIIQKLAILEGLEEGRCTFCC